MPKVATNLSNEKRIRRFMKVKAEEAVKAKNRMKSKKKAGDSMAIAAKKCGMSRDSGKRGEAVIRVIDDLLSQGKTKEADTLRDKLNQSIFGAYGEIETGKEGRAKVIDSNICTRIYGLARKIDERLELKGGDKHRNECIELLKKLSAKHEEWRSE